MTAAPTVPAGWYPDPTGRHSARYWDGVQWTPWVMAGGEAVLDGPAAGAGATAADWTVTSSGISTSDPAMRWLLPIGRSPWAIAAGYAGLFAFLILPAPIALGLGITALVSLRRHPGQLGYGRAIFGTTIGALGSLLLALALLS